MINGEEIITNTPVEPLVADVRGTGKKEIHRKMEQEILHLLAPMLSCSYDELKQRHKEYKLKFFIAALSIVSILAVAFSIYAVHQSMKIDRQHQNTMTNQARYLSKVARELLDSGDRDGALKTAIALSYMENGEEQAYAQEQVYALNDALRAYQYLEEYHPIKKLEFDSEFGVSDGQLSSQGRFYLNFRCNPEVYPHHNAFFYKAPRQL